MTNAAPAPKSLRNARLAVYAAALAFYHRAEARAEAMFRAWQANNGYVHQFGVEHEPSWRAYAKASQACRSAHAALDAANADVRRVENYTSAW